MTRQEKATLTNAIAVYAQVSGLSRFVIRASKELTAKALAYVAKSRAAAVASYTAK